MKISTIKNKVLQSCSYILSEDGFDEIFIVDCGDIFPIVEYINREKKCIGGVILTHGHYDHIYGLNELLDQYPKIKVFATDTAINALSDPDLNLSYLYDIDEDYIVKSAKFEPILVSDNTEISLFNSTLYCIYTPGHSVDCMSYLVDNVIFTGDSYNPSVQVYAKWSNSDSVLAYQNEKIIKSLIEKHGLFVYPGHYFD